jgi:ATP-dependent helicase/nuclease subunit B
MPVERHFLGWDEALTAKICAFLLPETISGPVDLSGQLIIVPTRQAGRRLREAMALRCASRNTALLAAQVVTPGVLIKSVETDIPEADPVLAKALWADVLLNSDPHEFGGLFPAGLAERDFTWALNTGEMIQDLRKTLATGAYTINDVISSHAKDIEEHDRWKDMAQLETIYLKRLREMELADPCVRMIESARAPGLPVDTQRIVVAAVLDLAPLHAQMLAQLSKRLPISILVPAPPSLAGSFDEWGRPDPGKWRNAILDVPHPSANILVATSPSGQSRAILSEIARESEMFGPADIAVGVADGGVVPFLKAELEQKNIAVYDPSDKSLKNHALCNLIASFSELFLTGSYQAFRTILRHPDVLRHLETKLQIQATPLLQQLDEFQNRHLPARLEDILHFFPKGQYSAGPGFEELAKSVSAVERLVASFSAYTDAATSIRQFLRAIYEDRTIDSQNADDEDFAGAANAVNKTMAGLEDVEARIASLNKEQALVLFGRALADETYHGERRGAAVDLEGWFELPWNDAPFLIVTGMNEGCVPDGRLDDVFLPDSFRSRLGLQCDAMRLARDTVIMTCLIESRRKKGRTCFICGKTNGRGDPLKPSRLLFRCKPDELLQRATALFGPARGQREPHPPTATFLLNPVPSVDVAPTHPALKKMPVTWFRDYLACPFRFYLKHVLGMETLDDWKREMDAADFGTMIHEVLNRAAKSAVFASSDEAKIGAILSRHLDDWARARFGSSPSLPILISLDAAKHRLAAVAHVQAQLVRDKWRIIETERRFSIEIKGLEVTGTIDRIDRNEETGQIRIIDYKTTDSAVQPERAHFGPLSDTTPDFAKVPVKSRTMRWSDLQLPLYMTFVLSEDAPEREVEVAYFNIPKAVNDTSVQCWKDFNQDTVKSAYACAIGVVEAVQSGVFWPPSERIEPDNFEALSPGADTFDPLAFTRNTSEETPRHRKR